MADFGIGEGLALGSLVMAAAGAGVSAYGSYQQQSAANAANQYNEQVAKDQQAQAQQLGTFAEEQQQQQTAQLEGRQKAAYAAAGVDVNSGTPEIVNSQTAGYGALDAMAAKQQEEEAAWGYGNSATLDASKISNPMGAATTSLLSSSSTIGSGVKGLYTSGLIGSTKSNSSSS